MRLLALAIPALACATLLAGPAQAVPVPAKELCVSEVALAPGESLTNPTPYDLETIEVDIREAKLAHRNNENAITMEIAISNRNGKPTCANYAVFLTFNRPGGEPEGLPNGCQDQHFNDPDTPRGRYHCTALIEGPGDWQFTATVNRPALINQQNLTTVSTTLNFPNAVQTNNEDDLVPYIVEGSAFEVFLLQFHVAMSGLWMLLAATMGFLAVPRLRRTLSVLAVHTLEVRRGFLVSSMWGTFGGTLGTGLYLLAAQTAYDAPFSTNGFSLSAWENLGNLPYAQNYFLVLYGKILLFGLMAAASTILMLEASRVARIAVGAEGLEADEDDDMWSRGVHFDEEGHVRRDEDVAVAGGAVGSVNRTAVEAQRRTAAALGVDQRTLSVCVAVLVVGALAVGAAVTGLKYMHELIETAAAAAILRSGG